MQHCNINIQTSALLQNAHDSRKNPLHWKKFNSGHFIVFLCRRYNLVKKSTKPKKIFQTKKHFLSERQELWKLKEPTLTVVGPNHSAPLDIKNKFLNKNMQHAYRRFS